jgi:hypothetical protein
MQLQPVVSLRQAQLMESLVAALHAGEPKIDLWTTQHHCVSVVFKDTPASPMPIQRGNWRGCRRGEAAPPPDISGCYALRRQAQRL